MKFRTKIKLSYIILAIVPLLAMNITLLTTGRTQLNKVEEQFGIENIELQSLSNPPKLYSKITNEEYHTLLTAINEDVTQLESKDYLDSFNQKLKQKHSFLVVRKGDSFIYNGNNLSDDVLFKLPTWQKEHSPISENVISSYIYEDYKYLIKQIDFVFPDDEFGCIYLMTTLKELTPQVESILLRIIISIIVIVILSSLLLSLWIYRSIMKPIRKLTEATKRIADGDLDFTIASDDKDEFGDLCNDFETMRKRLKESAETSMEEELEHKELLSNISHDLKTPITAIKGYVEGIMDGVADNPEKMDRYIKTIYNKANDMDRLIGELTLYSNIDTNRIPYHFEKINVHAYFEDCVEELTIELTAKNIQLNYFNYVEKDIIIIADVEQMKRVINNIVSNSVKYIGNKTGALNIRILDDNDFIHIEIEDNGKGIATKDLPYIFDRFYRTDASRNSNQGGSGIGLSIVKKIIEVHGGKIWATSQLNTGTTMHIILRKYVEPSLTEESTT